MKKLKFMLAAILVAVVSMIAVSCTKSDDNSSSGTSDYTVEYTFRGGGDVSSEYQQELNDLFKKDYGSKFKNITRLQASVLFNQAADASETLLKSSLSGKIPEDLYVTITLKDKSGNYVTSKDFTVKA